MSRTTLDRLNGFRSDERGTIAVTFGLCVTMIFLFVGLAIDYGRTIHSNSRLASAMDAAALAAAKGMRLEGLTDTEATTLAQMVFNQNMANTSGNWVDINAVNVTLDRNQYSAQIDVSASVKTLFASIAGVMKYDLPKSAVAIFESKDIEVGLQLDTTGSMGSPSGSGNTKIQDLRLATAELIDILLPDKPTGQKVRIGVAPFSSGVNAGGFLKAVDGNRSSSNGCVYERSVATFQAADDAPTGGAALKIKSDLGSGAQDCPNATVLPLTDDKVALKAKAMSLSAGGTTAGHLGTAWAWYLLSPAWQSIWNLTTPVANYNDGHATKVAILMTDGEYNTIGGIMSGANVTSSSQTAADTCAAMRAKGVIVYTVGFKLTNATAISTLEGCASGSDHAIRAENGDELRAAFKKIATQIMSLRLSK